MSEKFLLSPSLLLDTLLKEMNYRLNNHPMLAVKFEKVEYFYGRFQLLFHGEYRPIKFEAALLHSCVMLYCKCILIFINDNLDKLNKDEVDYLNRWLSILDNLGDVDRIKNKFTFLMPVLEILINEDLPLWVKKEFILHINRIFEKPTRLIFAENEKRFFFATMATWLKLLITCGDYEFQTILVEAIINTCELCHIEEVLKDNFGKDNVWTTKFLQVYSRKNYVNDLKTLLIAINDSFGYVRSVPCLRVTLEETVIPPLKGMNSDTTWMHVNFGFRTLSFSCNRDTLRSLPSSTNHLNSHEFVSVNFEDVGKICLLINNGSKTVKSVGGMFLITLTGKCVCRFNSSKEIVSSIKKINLTVPEGDHLQFLKNEFTKLFGKNFKESSIIPIKKKKDVLDKRDSSLTSSTQNSSHHIKSRKRTEKRHVSTRSPGSFLKQNIKLENSLTLENTDCVLNSTESTFKKKVVVHNKETTNSQPKFTNNKENEIVDNLLQKDYYKNTNNKEDSENCRLFTSPDTTTNEFMNNKKTGSIISSHSTNKTKKGKGGNGTTKKHLSLLKNLDIEILTTSINKEMQDSSEISPVFATTEEMNISSNNTLEEDNSLIITEGNKSLILDFINNELNSIPDLRSPLDLKKNKSSKRKTSKAKKVKHTSNFGIADSSSMKASSSTSKSISNAKNDGLRFGATHTESSSEKSKLNDLQKPKITYKCKKSTSSVTSNNSSQHKQDREHRRRQNKESIDKSKTVNRSLHASETVESDFICANPKRSKARDRVNLKNKENEVLIDYVESNYNLRNENKGRRRNVLNMNNALQSTEEIVNTKKSNKNLISKPRVEFYNKKNPSKIDQSFSLGNTEVINEIVIENEIVNEEESEYYSIVQDDVPPKVNKESNQMDNYYEISTLNLENDDLLTLDDDTVNGGEIEYYSLDLLTLDNDTVNGAESEYYSINSNVAPIQDNSATPDLDVENQKEKTKMFKSHPLKKLMLMNSEDIINLSVEEKSDNKVNESDRQILAVEGNNSETPNVDLNFFKSANIANSKTRKLRKFNHGKNKQEAIIEQDKNNDEEASEYYSFNPDITSTENNKVTSGMPNSESVELNFNRDNNKSIATPNMGNKNGRISKASSLKELSITNNSFTPKNITEQCVENEEPVNSELTVRRVNSTEENVIFSNASYYQKSNQLIENSETPDLDIILARNTNIVSENNTNENMNEEMSINNVRLSAETVKINNCSFLSNTPEDITQFMSLYTAEEQMRSDDEISIISISSTEELDSDASTKVIDFQMYSFENQQIEDKQYDVPISGADMKKMQIPEIIQDGRKTQNEGDDHLSSTELDDNATTETHSESVKNKQIAQEKIENNMRYDDMKSLQIIEITDIISEEMIPDVKEKEKDDHVIIISTSSTEGNVSDTKLDNKATNVDVQTNQIPKIIKVVSEKQENKDDQIIIISTSSNERNISGTELDDKAIEISYPENKTDEDLFNKFASNESKGRPSTVDDNISVPIEINEFDVDHFELTAVPILLNEIDGTISNDMFDLNRTNIDVSLTDLSKKHQEILNKSSEDLEELKNSFKPMEHISSNISCNERSAFAVQNKINILSNIRIAPPFCNKINQSHDDIQLLKEKNVAKSNDLQEANNEKARLRAKLADKTQKLEEMERKCKKTLELTCHNSELSKACGKKSVPCTKRKRTKEPMARKSKANSKICNKKCEETNSFQELIESPRNRLPDNNFLLDKFLANSNENKTFEKSDEETNYFQNLEKPLKSLSTKKLLRNKSSKSTQSIPKTNLSIESNKKCEEINSFQEFIESPRNRLPDNNFLLDKFLANSNENKTFEKSDEETNYFQNLEKPLKSLSTKKLLRNKSNKSTQSTPKTNISIESDFEMSIARNEVNSRELEFSPKKSLFDEIAINERKNVTPLMSENETFSPVLFNKSPLNQSAVKNKRKFSQDGEEFSLTSASQNAEKRIKLAEGVQLSHKIHQPEEDNIFEKLIPESVNEHKKSASSGKLTHKMEKSKVHNLEMIEPENEELGQSREFVSIRKASQKSFATSKTGTKKLTNVQPTPKTRKSKKLNEDLNFIQLFESISNKPQLHKSQPVKVKKLIKEKSKENSLNKLEVINEEFGLITKQSTVSGNELNKNIEFDDIQMDNGGLFDLISKPHKLYEKRDKTTKKVGRDIGNKRNEILRDEHYYNTVDEIYGFDAMLSGLKTYLKTWKLPKERSKKPQKRRIIKMKFGSHKNRLTKKEKEEFWKPILNI